MTAAPFDSSTASSDDGRGLRQRLSYDLDQTQMLYGTPHRWTPDIRLAARRRATQTERHLWDDKHQVLATRDMPLGRVLIWFKLIELAVQGRPTA